MTPPAVVTLTEDVLESWQSLVDTMAQVFDVPAGLIIRLDGDEIEVFVSSRTPGNPYQPGDSEPFFDSGLYCETVIRTGSTLAVPDALADPEWSGNPDVKLSMVSYLGMPINLPDGRPFGTICVLDNKSNAHGDLYVRLLGQFKTLVEGHLGLAVLNEQLAVQNRTLRQAMADVVALQQIIPVCMKCKNVRDDDGYCSRIESYVARHQKLLVSHALCPDRAEEW